MKKLTLEEIEKRINQDNQLLDLSYCRLIAGEIPLLCDYLKDNPNITKLKLYNNYIGDEGAKLLAANTTVKMLNIGYNNIGINGAKALAANTTITTLYIRHNHIEVEGAKLLALSTNLTTLDIGYNQITEEDAKDLLSVLKFNTKLIKLLHTFLDKQTVESITKLLSRNKLMPWLSTIKHARLMAQAQRSEDCLLGKLPLEILGLINNYAVAANHFSFFRQQFYKRPTSEDLIAVNKMVLS